MMLTVLEVPEEPLGMNAPILVLAEDDQWYWIKCPSDRIHRGVPDRSLINEQVVSACGQLLDAPVRQTRLLQVPEGIAGQPIGLIAGRPRELAPGIVHGSLHLEEAEFEKDYQPPHGTRDDNRRRHLNFYALWDWCWGEDRQWLHDTADDYRTYSHDHGLFLPEAGWWSEDDLHANVHEPHTAPHLITQFEPSQVDTLRDRLESIESDQLLDILAGLPTAWGANDRDLETLGWFLDVRRHDVAQRLSRMVDAAGPPPPGDR